jgi:DNA-binding response OmpR family regulator
MARILIIDDDERIRELLRLDLHMSGHEVFLAREGEEGLEIFHNKKVDLVVTDILMPHKEGIQTIMELRAEYPDVKIVAISGGGAFGAEKYLSMAKDLGADRILTKPFSLAELKKNINELLSKISGSGYSSPEPDKS